MSRGKVLVVDDEHVVTEVLERYLRREDFEVATADDGESALRLAREWGPDLIVLDLMLPKIDGFEICRVLRQESRVPIVMLTARGETTDRIVGLEIGADDYVVKPFSPGELVARIKAVLRRTATGINPAASAEVIRFPGFPSIPRPGWWKYVVTAWSSRPRSLTCFTSWPPTPARYLPATN